MNYLHSSTLITVLFVIPYSRRRVFYFQSHNFY